MLKSAWEDVLGPLWAPALGWQKLILPPPCPKAAGSIAGSPALAALCLTGNSLKHSRHVMYLKSIHIALLLTAVAVHLRD